MKIIVAGDGDTGSYLAQMLSVESQDVILIGYDREHLAELDTLGNFITFEGNPLSRSDLMECGADRADLFVTMKTPTLRARTTTTIRFRKRIPYHRSKPGKRRRNPNITTASILAGTMAPTTIREGICLTRMSRTSLSPMTGAISTTPISLCASTTDR